MHSCIQLAAVPARYNHTTSGLTQFFSIINTADYLQGCNIVLQQLWKNKQQISYRSLWLLYSLAAALLLKFRKAILQGRIFCLGHFICVGGSIAGSPSSKQSQRYGESWRFKGWRIHLEVTFFWQQQDLVSRSLGCRNKKSAEGSKIGT